MPKKNSINTSGNSEQIYKAAARIFAQKGYAGTSTRDIAAAVGLNISTVNYHVGGKETLYREILRRTYIMEQGMFANLLDDIDSDVYKSTGGIRSLFKKVVDTVIDRILSEPETYRLWTYHFLESSQELYELKKEFSLPFYEMMLEITRKARAAGTISKDEWFMKIFIVSFSWFLHGYFNGMKNDWGVPGYDPFQESQIADLRRYLEIYINQMLPTEAML